MTQATKINWKDDSKNLTKLYPPQFDEDDGETLADPGSFFNFFEVARDYNDVSSLRLCKG
jgi:template-activating factor I